MADVITSNAQLATTKNDLITSLVQRELKFAAKLLPTITDVSQYAVKGVRSISFPKLTSFTVVNRTSGVAGDASALTASVDKLDLNFNAYVAWLIDSFDDIQTSINAQAEFAMRAASAHGRYVDTQISTALLAAAGYPAGAGDITKAKILDMREFLLSNDAIMSDIVLVIAVDQEKAMLEIDEFTKNDIFGRPTIYSGQIGQVYGVPIIVHNGLSAGAAVMYEKAGLVIGFQKSPAISDQSANEYGTAARRFAMDQLFGIKGMQLGEKGLGATESPLIARNGA